MRIFVYGLMAVPLLVLDGVFLYTFPLQATRFYSAREGWPVLAGALVYILVHGLFRKPERMYVWGHEFAHLVVAKLFLRRVHGFHISSRDGGKVVMDGTNVLIDLAPYILPLYSLAAIAAAELVRPKPQWLPPAYLAVASFLFTMHVLFSAEGFLDGQPDVRRSGRIFSFGLFLLFVLFWIPCLLAPGASGGWGGAGALYRDWISAGEAEIRRLLLSAGSLLRRLA